MYNDDFDAWIKGYFLLETNLKPLTFKQLTIIHQHLKLVEEVEEKLDTNNLWLRNVLNQVLFINKSKSSDLSQISENIRTRYLADLQHQVNQL